ncbi:ubiquinol-cytochrome-c reductase complex assembly factor 4 [Cololabis saira]|uniref:ubiquinol-cytochrome-c reductase complex assembly factor 4 n=1 Tax=Cololabis saira TaxID=129043 RepID=UPI002AD516C4|nr:ubiquinol-cytochrome-c reductase complex assembly factor 4 [Cololabis saira]
MSIAPSRVFSCLTRVTLGQGIFVNNVSATVRKRITTRSLTLSTQMSAKAPTEDEMTSEPIKFSTSQASHKTWRVNRSMGSQYQRPWWKVVPISVVFTGFLLWCVLRGETDIDTQLEKQLYEQLPGLLSDEDENAENK